MTGRVPIREHGAGQAPMPGWTDGFEWTGYIPFEQLPSVLNPAKGYVVSANNKTTDDSYPYLIETLPAFGYRARRIAELLEEREQLTVADLAAIQRDTFSAAAAELIPYYSALRFETPLHPLKGQTAEELAERSERELRARGE